MSRRITGTVLLLISALLYAARYLSAAIYGSSIPSDWSADIFDAMLQYVGQGLVTWSLVALIAGVVYLIWAEVDTIWTQSQLSPNESRSSPK